jgi:hypothetical protein
VKRYANSPSAQANARPVESYSGAPSALRGGEGPSGEIPDLLPRQLPEKKIN